MKTPEELAEEIMTKVPQSTFKKSRKQFIVERIVKAIRSERQMLDKANIELTDKIAEIARLNGLIEDHVSAPWYNVESAKLRETLKELEIMKWEASCAGARAKAYENDNKRLLAAYKIMKEENQVLLGLVNR